MITSGTYIVSDAALFTSPPPNRLPPFLSTLFPDPDEDELAIFALFPVPVPVAIGPVIDSALSRFAFFRDLGSLGGSWPWIGVGIGEGVEGGILDVGCWSSIVVAIGHRSAREGGHVVFVWVEFTTLLWRTWKLVEVTWKSLTILIFNCSGAT
jgi:hypothetical protein